MKLEGWETCMQVKKQQLELDMEQQAGSKLRKEYINETEEMWVWEILVMAQQAEMQSSIYLWNSKHLL